MHFSPSSLPAWAWLPEKITIFLQPFNIVKRTLSRTIERT
jgi:hypothetical protein